MALLAPGLVRRVRLKRLGAMALAGLALIGPWVGYNLARFEKPVLLSTGAGVTLVNTSCDSVFSGSFIGWWNITCIPTPKSHEESVNDAANRHVAFEYLGRHRGDLPRVWAARVGRIWGVFRPWQTATLDGRGLNADRIGLIASYVLIPLAVVGGVVLRRRRRPILPMVALVAMVTVTAAIFYGAIRFRVPADVAIVLCAAVALDAGLSRWRIQKFGSTYVPVPESSNATGASAPGTT
jgi:hypothetical protein